MINYRIFFDFFITGLDLKRMVGTDRKSPRGSVQDRYIINYIQPRALKMRKHPEAEGMSDELRRLQELGVLRFENITVSWIVS